MAIEERSTEEKLAHVIGNVAEIGVGVKTLSKNIYTDLSAQDESHREEIANLTTMVNDLGNSLMEAGVQRKKDTDHLFASLLTLHNRCADLNERTRRLEKRMDNAATFGNGAIQDAFRQIRDLRAQLDADRAETHALLNAINTALNDRAELPDGCEYPDCTPPQPQDDLGVNDDAGEWPAATEGAMSAVVPNLEASETGMARFVDLHAPAPVTGTPVAVSEAAPEVKERTFAEWREQTISDAAFLRFIATEKYSFPAMVRDGLIRVAERLENAANLSDGSWV